MQSATLIDTNNPVLDTEPLWFGVEVADCATPGCPHAVDTEGDHCSGCCSEQLDVARQVRLLDAGAAMAPVAVL